MGASTTWTRTLLVALLLSAGATLVPDSSVVSAAGTPTISYFKASRHTITVGQTTKLSWVVYNATSVSINQGIGTVKSTGSVIVSPTQTTTYVLTASNGQTNVTRSLTITVQATAVPTIESFAASPASITAGQSSVLSWVVTNAVSITVNGKTVAGSGSMSVTPSQTTTYTLTATNTVGTVSQQATVTVQAVPPPTISSFTAAPSAITTGQSSTLSWVVTNATSVSVAGTAVAASGSMTVTPSQTTAYTLTATNAGGSVSRQVTVTVTPPDTTPPVVSNGQPTGTLAAGTTSVTLSVTTNENATCGYATSAGTAFAAMTTFATTGQTSHSTPLTGLAAGTYTYYVKCSDTAGNVDPSDYVTSFTIASPPVQAGFCPAWPAATGNTVTVSTTSALVNAVANSPSGTTILVADGTYTGVDLVFRTPNVTLRSKSGNRDGVVIDGNYQVGEVLSVYAAHVTIADLSLSHPINHPVHLGGGGDYAMLYNLHLIDAGEQFVKVNPDTSGNTNDYGTLACSLLELTPAGRSYVETTTAASTGFACYTGGIDGHAAWGWEVRDNTIRDIYCDSGLAEHGIHFWDTSRDTVVERNVLINDARAIGFGLGTTASGRAYPDNPLAGTGLVATSVGHIGGVIRNNFIYADTTHFDTAIGFEEAWKASVFHNTVFSTVGGLGIDVRYANSVVAVENNLATPGLDQRDSGQVSANAGNFAATANMFVSPATGDLHLASAGVALKGVSLNGLVPTDIDGETRGTPPDSGADEYLGGVQPGARARLATPRRPRHGRSRRRAQPAQTDVRHAALRGTFRK